MYLQHDLGTSTSSRTASMHPEVTVVGPYMLWQIPEVNTKTEHENMVVTLIAKHILVQNVPQMVT
jgi:hypothetical protein